MRKNLQSNKDPISFNSWRDPFNRNDIRLFALVIFCNQKARRKMTSALSDDEGFTLISSVPTRRAESLQRARGTRSRWLNLSLSSILCWLAPHVEWLVTVFNWQLTPCLSESVFSGLACTKCPPSSLSLSHQSSSPFVLWLRNNLFPKNVFVHWNRCYDQVAECWTGRRQRCRFRNLFKVRIDYTRVGVVSR